MSAASKTRTVHYVMSTHWDREWYEPFQFYRYRLVQLLDRVIEGLEDGRLHGPFQTDGQSIVLDDYLEIRPENRARVEKLCRERKLVVGPWYVLPDEFLVSGESHIRNIRLGREIARSYGHEPSDAGFVCDLFGHISQMPQIFAGFGIEGGFLWRGVCLVKTRHLIWEGADGTEMTCFHFPFDGYGDFTIHVRKAGDFDSTFDAAEKEKIFDDYVAREAAASEMSPVLVFDGCDHQEWDQEFYTVMVKKFEGDKKPYVYVHSDLDQYIKAMMAERSKIKARRSGELRQPGTTPGEDGHIIHSVLSSRAWIKQSNAACENLLCQWAEPASAYANLTLGFEYPDSYLDHAWRFLLQNHPHDSICGCSIDQVHEDMKYRFSQSSQIGERLTQTALSRIAANVQGEIGEKELRVTLFNPLSVPFSGVVDLPLAIPEDYPTFREFFGFEALPVFTVHGPDGKEIPFQRNGQPGKRTKLRIYDWKLANFYPTFQVDISLNVEIPAMGYTTLTVKPATQNHPKRHPQDTGLAVGERAIENEFLRAQIESNGTLTLTDKRTGEVYTDLLTIEDRADIGDGWFHGVAVNDEIHYSSASSAEIALLVNGPRMAAFRIRTTMNVPEEFDFAAMKRVERRRDIVIESVVRLRAGADRLEVETTVHNNICDHRMRALFPTDATVDSYETDTPFDAVERPIALAADNHLGFELDVETKPMQGWCAIAGEKRGLAVISTGQYEACVRNTEHRPIALTLFRGTRRTVGRDGEPNGQLLGDLQFKYWIKPLRKGIDRVDLFRDAQLIAGGLRTAQLRLRDQKIHAAQKTLSAKDGLFSVSGSAVVTSARLVGGALELRVFNPLGKKASATIALQAAAKSYKKAQRVDFESKPIGKPLEFKKGSVKLDLGRKQIQTIRFS